MCAVGFRKARRSEGGEWRPDHALAPRQWRAFFFFSRKLGRAIKQQLGVGNRHSGTRVSYAGPFTDAMDRMVGLAYGALAVQLLARKENARIGRTAITATCRSVTLEPLQKVVAVSGLYDPALFITPKLMRVEGMPISSIRERCSRPGGAVNSSRYGSPRYHHGGSPGAAEASSSVFQIILRIVDDVRPIAGPAKHSGKRTGRTCASLRFRQLLSFGR